MRRIRARHKFVVSVFALLTMATQGHAKTVVAQQSQWSEGFDWSTIGRYKGSTHEHAGAEQRVAHYIPGVLTSGIPYTIDDYAEPYNWVAYMSYSGSDQSPAYWTELHWPLASWFAGATIPSWDSLPPETIIYANAEQVFTGATNTHVSTPFLRAFIAEFGISGFTDPPKDPAWMFETRQEELDLIHTLGFADGLPGFAIINHPSLSLVGNGYPAYDGVEVYNAIFRHWWWESVVNNGGDMTDCAGTCSGSTCGTACRIDTNVTNYEQAYQKMLMLGQTPCPFAVSDHATVYNRPTIEEGGATLRSEEVGSGYTIALAPVLTEFAIREAFSRCRVVAVMDLAVWPKKKGGAPRLDDVKISADRTLITLSTTAPVEWVSDGAVVGTGSTLDVSTLAGVATHIYARLGPDEDGSMVWTPAWVLAQRLPTLNRPGVALLVSLLVSCAAADCKRRSDCVARAAQASCTL